jgi:hypothetical protein
LGQVGERVPAQNRSETDNAFTSTRNGPDRDRRPALVGQSLHTDAGNDQVHLECSGSHRRSFVATEYFRTIPLSFPNPHWGLSKTE